jgi:hypothetical protein
LAQSGDHSRSSATAIWAIREFLRTIGYFGTRLLKTTPQIALSARMLTNRPHRRAEISETNAGKPWDGPDLFFVVSGIRRGIAIDRLAGFLRRPASEVQEKARELQAGRRRTALQWKKGHRG